jgi:ABC-type branched-subunit amino acid transport system permease subunit
MNKLMTTFDYFLTTSTPKVYLMQFVINLIIAALLAHFLKKIYIRYGKAVSNRARFASNFFLMVTTTMLIISIVKSSLALSLGLVGALSIVRFRTAIKEPEELAVLFFCN